MRLLRKVCLGSFFPFYLFSSVFCVFSSSFSFSVFSLFCSLLYPSSSLRSYISYFFLHMSSLLTLLSSFFFPLPLDLACLASLLSSLNFLLFRGHYLSFPHRNSPPPPSSSICCYLVFVLVFLLLIPPRHAVTKP